MTIPELHEQMVQVAFEQLLSAKTDTDRRIAGKNFTLMVQQRNESRTQQEIARLERAKGLR